jgi:hypothetical protein
MKKEIADEYSCTQALSPESWESGNWMLTRAPKFRVAALQSAVNTVTAHLFLTQLRRMNSTLPTDTKASDSSFSFRTLAGEHTLMLQPNETPEQAVARFLQVDQRRVVLQMLDHEAFVILQPPLEIYHNPRTASYCCPPGFLELYRQNLDKMNHHQWYTLAVNPGVVDLLEENREAIGNLWFRVCGNPNRRVIELIQSSLQIASGVVRSSRDVVDWAALSGNPSSTFELLASHWKKINWSILSLNTNTDVLRLIPGFSPEPEVGSSCSEFLAQGLKRWIHLSANPHAIHMLATNLQNVDWTELSLNPNAIELLAAHVERIDWQIFANNPNPKAMEVMEANLDQVDWIALSRNPNAIELLSANLDKVSWYFLSANPRAIDLLSANMDQVDWDALSTNPNAIHLLEANISRVNWGMLCRNPNGVGMLKEHFEQIKDKMNWMWLSCNPSAAELLKANPEHIDWSVCCQAMPWTEIRH